MFQTMSARDDCLKSNLAFLWLQITWCEQNITLSFENKYDIFLHILFDPLLMMSTKMYILQNIQMWIVWMTVYVTNTIDINYVKF